MAKVASVNLQKKNPLALGRSSSRQQKKTHFVLILILFKTISSKLCEFHAGSKRNLMLLRLFNDASEIEGKVPKYLILHINSLYFIGLKLSPTTCVNFWLGQRGLSCF